MGVSVFGLWSFLGFQFMRMVVCYVRREQLNHTVHCFKLQHPIILFEISVQHKFKLWNQESKLLLLPQRLCKPKCTEEVKGNKIKCLSLIAAQCWWAYLSIWDVNLHIPFGELTIITPQNSTSSHLKVMTS